MSENDDVIDHSRGQGSDKVQSDLLVAPITTTEFWPCCDRTPSNCTRNSVLRRRPASCSPLDRSDRIESISSAATDWRQSHLQPQIGVDLICSQRMESTSSAAREWSQCYVRPQIEDNLICSHRMQSTSSSTTEWSQIHLQPHIEVQYICSNRMKSISTADTECFSSAGRLLNKCSVSDRRCSQSPNMKSSHPKQLLA